MNKTHQECLQDLLLQLACYFCWQREGGTGRQTFTPLTIEQAEKLARFLQPIVQKEPSTSATAAINYIAGRGFVSGMVHPTFNAAPHFVPLGRTISLDHIK